MDPNQDNNNKTSVDPTQPPVDLTPPPPPSTDQTYPLDAQPGSTPPADIGMGQPLAQDTIIPTSDTPAPEQPNSSGPSWSSPTPTFMPPAPPPAPEPPAPEQPAPSWLPPVPDSSSSYGPVPSPTESAPTDLSHLAGNPASLNPTSGLPATGVPETLIVTPASIPQNVVTGGGTGGGFPKWMLAVGIVVILAVAGASAYFILGIGKPAKKAATTVQAPPVTIPVTVPPVLTPPPATVSAGFGNLSGATPPSSTSSGQSTSALELLRQRQGQ